MRYNLYQLSKGREATLRAIEVPTDQAMPLYRIGAQVVTGVREEVLARVLPLYEPRPTLTQDSAADILAAALSLVRLVSTRLVATLDPKIEDWATRVEEWHRSRYTAAVKAGTGVDVSSYLLSADAQEEVQAATKWASSLITNVDEQLLTKVENKVWAAYSGQVPRKELAKELAEDLKISRTRAMNIARDQTAKLASNLDQMRQLEAGVEEYKWRHSGKLHPRKPHVAREGKIFAWNDPPEDGHPGQAINCGCRARAFMRLKK